MRAVLAAIAERKEAFETRRRALAMVDEIFGLFEDWAEEVLRFALARIGDELRIPMSLQAAA